jgi:hypothetical protein
VCDTRRKSRVEINTIIGTWRLQLNVAHREYHALVSSTNFREAVPERTTRESMVQLQSRRKRRRFNE